MDTTSLDPIYCPSLVLSVQGEVLSTNLPEFREHMLAQIKAADVELVTDEDFKNGDITAKALRDGAKQVAEAKDNALKQMEDVYAKLTVLDEIGGAATATALKLEKQIKTRKEERKKELIADAREEIKTHWQSLCEDRPILNNLKYDPLADYQERADKAVYRKSSLEKMEESLTALVEEVCREANALNIQVQSNEQLINDIPKEHMAVFQDAGQLITMNTDLLTAEIAKRIAVHKQDLAEQREREAREKAEAEERDRKAAEEKAAETPQSESPPEQQSEPEAAETPVSDAQPAVSASESSDGQYRASGEVYIIAVSFTGPLANARTLATAVKDSADSAIRGVGLPDDSISVSLTTPAKLREKYSIT